MALELVSLKQVEQGLKATRTSDLGYEDDGLGVNSVAGDMILFDIDPTKWSRSDGSPDFVRVE